MTPNSGSTGGLWARFRFSVVGSLLSSPPASGTLGHAIRSLAEKTWSHPLTGHDVRVAAGTIGAGTTRRSASLTTRSAPSAVPCAKTAARSRWRRPSPSDLFSSTAITRTGAINCTMTTSPRLEGRSLTGAASLLFHGQALHAGSRPGAQTKASARARPGEAARRPDARHGRSAATKPPTSGRSGISTSITGRSRCSLPAASGCGRSRWASWTIIRDCVATFSGTCQRRRSVWCTDCPRRSRSAGCRVRS